MYEVSLQNLADECLELYRERYQAKYGIAPMIQNMAHAMTTFKDLIRKQGDATAKRLIEQYLSNDGEGGWYKRHGHNLVIFQKNLEALASQIGLKDRQTNPHMRRKILLRFDSECPRCRGRFELVTENPQDCHSVPCPKCQK